MKRLNNLYSQITSLENLQLADQKARKGKLHQPSVKQHDLNRETNIFVLQQMLIGRTYKTSEYTTFPVYEPKERLVYRLPYWPDRIAHHAIMNVLEPHFVQLFTKDTYSCIKKRGIHAAARNLKASLKDVPTTTYCLKLDIKKFYPSVDHKILKEMLRDKFKDQDLLWLLDEIIDSAEGLPIGNYLSQYLANFYLAYFDHWIKEEKHERHYFRYADDIVILSNDKAHLHLLLHEIRNYLQDRLNLKVKGNYQVFPVAARGIDFVGYVFFHDHIMLRKSIKKSFARKLAAGANRASVASYTGWLKHGNCKHLLKKLLNEKLQRTGHKA
jgi:retron-type reverse transcriptase